MRLFKRDAIDAGRRAFKLSPQGPEVMKTLLKALIGGGLHALNSSSSHESISHFGKYLRLDSSNDNACLNVGKAYLGNQPFA